MSFLDKLEKKMGKHAIPNLMIYVIGAYVLGYVVYMINPTFYEEYLSLDMDMVLKGQVWRLITFIIQPIYDDIFSMLIMGYLYYSIGSTLEKLWGSFRFNVYIFSGIILNIIVVVVIYLVLGISYPVSMKYINMSLFLAFATMFAETQFLLMFFIPIKAKYLAILYGVLIVFDVYSVFRIHWVFGLCELFVALASVANYLFMFFQSRSLWGRINPKQIHRRNTFKREYNSGMNRGENRDKVIHFSPRGDITRHKCAICGRTEKDDDSLEFRFCSKCEGNYEYCSEHLYTHTHVINGVPYNDSQGN